MAKLPGPRQGGSQDHNCDDRGRSQEKNGRLYTHCSICGAVVAIDELGTDDDNGGGFGGATETRGCAVAALALLGSAASALYGLYELAGWVL